ncbi:hypothetical protein LTR50_003924 [Elasticomyces elasticus]|nr:hypothetical protein LTR50_003924 [Elasticomyces elasticus]
MPLIRKRRPPTQEDASDSEPAPRAQRRRPSPEAEDEAYDDGAAPDATQGDSGSLDQMVKKLVRLALACEYARIPVRRTEITAKVLGAQSRQFNAVFAEARLQLQSVFGMEMVELPLKDRVTIAQKRGVCLLPFYVPHSHPSGIDQVSEAAQKSQTAQKNNGRSNAWTLVSTLPHAFRDPVILPPPKIPTTQTESQYTALYTFIISLVELSGGTLKDSALDRYLKRVNASDSTVVDGYDRTEKLLQRMIKDGYLVKIRENQGGEETIEWIVGPRGRVEVGDEGVTGLVKTVFGAEDADEEQRRELDERIQKSLRLDEKAHEQAQATQQREQVEGERRRKGGRKRKGEVDMEEEEDGEEDE